MGDSPHDLSSQQGLELAATMVTGDSSTVPIKEQTQSSEEPFPVKAWERYQFLKVLGRGGMGAVYKARDQRLGRIVALKFISGSDSALVQRFQQEARAQARIDHPYICKIPGRCRSSDGVA